MTERGQPAGCSHACNRPIAGSLWTPARSSSGSRRPPRSGGSVSGRLFSLALLSGPGYLVNLYGCFGRTSQEWSTSWLAEQAHAGQSARWPSLARTEPPAAEWCSAGRGRIRRPGPRGRRPGPLARTGHRSGSCRPSRRRTVMAAAGLKLSAGFAARAASVGWPLRPGGHLGGELADPPHARRGRVGVVAELLGHPVQAAVDAEPQDGGGDCFCCHGGGRGVRSL
jgi:hypothetical protein